MSNLKIVNTKSINLILKALNYSNLAQIALKNNDFKKANELKVYSNFVLSGFNQNSINTTLKLKGVVLKK